MERIGLIIVLAIMCGYAQAQVDTQNCTRYKSYPNHTMCIYKPSNKTCPTGSSGTNIFNRAITNQTFINEVVNIHNTLRAKLVAGTVPGQPKAKSMNTIVWDNELAQVAQRAADQCVFAHDKMRDVPGYKVGQNIFMSSAFPIEKNINPNMTQASLAWWNEVSNPGFNPANISPFVFDSGSGHYTQMAWANTSRIGCGYTMFNGTGTRVNWSQKLVYCNYAYAGNFIGGTMYVKA